MRDICVIGAYFEDEHREKMRSCAEELGYEIEFYQTAEEAAGRGRETEILVCDDPEALEPADGSGAGPAELKWCMSCFAGVDKFLRTDWFRDGKIVLTNSSGAYGRSISEYIVMTSLMLLRRMPAYMQGIRNRQWLSGLRGRVISECRIGIVGTGDIGTRTARQFRNMEARSITGFNTAGHESEGFDQVRPVSELDDCLNEIDILVLCVPGTPATSGLFGRRQIELLPDDACVINVGRGSAVDQEAVTEALAAGKLGGCALDVTLPEPPGADDPLWDAPNLVLTPHMAGDMFVVDTIDQICDIFCDDLRRYSAGRPLQHTVNVQAGY